MIARTGFAGLSHLGIVSSIGWASLGAPVLAMDLDPEPVEALRAGNVAVTNSLGSGLLQQPAFLGFLPGLCRHLAAW